MLDYLSRTGYLQPYYVEPGVRGKVRYYSYRDLVVARTIQRLCKAGVELARLKVAIQKLTHDETWLPKEAGDGATSFRWLVTDGKRVLLKDDDGFLTELGPSGQRAFAFVVSLDRIQNEVIKRIPPGKRDRYSMENEPMDPALPARRNRVRP
jgi:DNA-binding transcriptional MerR regulator